MISIIVCSRDYSWAPTVVDDSCDGGQRLSVSAEKARVDTLRSQMNIRPEYSILTDVNC